MRAGITAGSISAVVAALLSLPLRSPDDILFNSGTVVIGALLAGLGAGVIWHVLVRRPKGLVIFAILWAVAFALIAVLAFAGEAQLDHFADFVLPLAAIFFLLTGLQIAAYSRMAIVIGWRMSVVAIAIALAVGIGLAGQGDEESGKLELPPRGASLPASPLEGLINSRIVGTEG